MFSLEAQKAARELGTTRRRPQGLALRMGLRLCNLEWPPSLPGQPDAGGQPPGREAAVPLCPSSRGHGAAAGGGPERPRESRQGAGVGEQWNLVSPSQASPAS